MSIKPNTLLCSQSLQVDYKCMLLPCLFFRKLGSHLYLSDYRLYILVVMPSTLLFFLLIWICIQVIFLLFELV